MEEDNDFTLISRRKSDVLLAQAESQTGALQHASKKMSAIWNHRHCKELPVDDRQGVGDRGCLVWGSRS